MKAIRYYRYGPPEVLQLEDVDLPAVGADDILVRVQAAAVNPLDFHFTRGTPYLLRATAGLSRPKYSGLGADMAGVVEAVGHNVTGLRPGDEVFGAGRGMFAEYVSRRPDAVLLAKPARLTFEQAAAVPVAGFTALQALRDKGRVQAGHKVLVNGAAGGVGTFAVQIAKALGAEVTGVCSTGNVELVRSIGADHVIDYTSTDFAGAGQRYDVVVDMIGNKTLTQYRRILTRHGVLVAVGALDGGQWLGPLAGMGRMFIYGRFGSQTMAPMLGSQSRDDLAVLSELIEAGKVTPVIDRTYSLTEVPDALRYLERKHARGKVIITV